MTEDQKKRLAKLKEKNRSFVLEQRRKQNALLQECLSSLGSLCRVVDLDTEHKCEAVVNSIYLCGLNPCQEIATFDEMPDAWIGEMVYVVWDEMTLPILHCGFDAIKESIYDVLAVNFETWFISEHMDKVICVNNNGKIELFCLQNGE